MNMLDQIDADEMKDAYHHLASSSDLLDGLKLKRTLCAGLNG